MATARAVVAAGFPGVATTSGGVTATLGYEDQEGAPADEMLAAAARIVRGVDVPVTVDAEAGYGMPPAELAAAGVADSAPYRRPWANGKSPRMREISRFVAARLVSGYDTFVTIPAPVHDIRAA